MPSQNDIHTSLRRFFIPPEIVDTACPEITGSEAGHICRVLRLSAGDEVELFDGTGSGYRAQIVSANPDQVRLSIVETYTLTTESPVRVTLALGFLKENKMDDLIRPLTELGIHCLQPFYAARSVSRPKAKGLEKRLDRWQKKALEAVKQCRRARIPTIEPADSLTDVLKASDSFDLKIFFWEGEPLAVKLPEQALPYPRSILAVVGPEGGFSEDEVQMAREHGFLICGMGPRILRAQTAAVAACTVLQYLFGDMGDGCER
ncbi:16S rRNA (uracil(1498)-N(3))-methyltransferase [uncultured Desulfosarcina sp.]|uniref:16S rRNA (uracil(1498)-N(3))-methyltransferase n=1 Tax=uncultured Desulfosarcina sp. TaxID=218289 RepID=UPI0029C6F443|nr:16S rRNA (uracil(1498)-N(3))-methyltransferase [uncultured Desulfosarcina sp.]